MIGALAEGAGFVVSVGSRGSSRLELVLDGVFLLGRGFGVIGMMVGRLGAGWQVVGLRSHEIH